MKKFKTFDSANVRELRHILEAAMDEFAKKNGLTVNVGNIRYDSAHVDVKLEINIDDGSGVDAYEQRLASDARKNAFLFGIKEGMIGKSVDIKNHGKCTFLGVQLRARKYPLVWKEANGQTFRSTEDYLKFLNEGNK